MLFVYIMVGIQIVRKPFNVYNLGAIMFTNRPLLNVKFVKIKEHREIESIKHSNLWVLNFKY